LRNDKKEKGKVENEEKIMRKIEKKK